MKYGDLSASGRLSGVRALLKGLPGPLGNGEMLAWANPGDADSAPQEVFRLLQGVAGILERWGPEAQRSSFPSTQPTS